MTLREAIRPYIDLNGLVSPHKASIPLQKESDNGVCFTSEYYIYLKKNGELIDTDPADYEHLMTSCRLLEGLYSRSPGDRGITPPDDQLALLAACKALKLPHIARDILNYGLRHYGSFNNEQPNKWTLKSFLWRQPQLLAAVFNAAGVGRYNPVVWVLNLYAALCILVSCYKVPKEETDPRRLSWLLIVAMEGSVLCKLASLVWKRRAIKDYGEDFMEEIAKIYYKDNHPFQTYARY